MPRPVVAKIRLDSFRHNYLLARSIHGQQALAVIKANAYGHGAVRCAQAIENVADGFAVASIEEALVLREAKIIQPILLLEGFFEATELPVIAQHDLWIVVHHEWQVQALLLAKISRPLNIWLKMDSGMHRVGLSPETYRSTYDQLIHHPNVAQIVLMSHFACADDTTSNHPTEQIQTFRSATAGLQAPVSLSNSAGILSWPKSHAQWGRIGIMLYGSDPTNNKSGDITSKLRPVMQLESKIISVRTLNQGEPVGYGCTFIADRTTRVGVVACGYADGYPRHAPTGTLLSVDGKLTRLLGRVSMDMLTVDLSDIPEATIGSRVELWGDQVLVGDVAKSAGTIAYELLCNVKRTRFEYSDTDKP
jgi:alanine racemase